MIGPDATVAASADEYRFQYGYKIDPNANGGISLRTQFSVEVTKLPSSGTYWMVAYVDGALVARTPVTLQR
jgi:hypothetical protein